MALGLCRYKLFLSCRDNSFLVADSLACACANQFHRPPRSKELNRHFLPVSTLWLPPHLSDNPSTMNSKELRLNHKAYMEVTDDLIRARFIKRRVLMDRKIEGTFDLHFSWTRDGTNIIANYAEVLVSVRNPTKRKIQALNALLVTQGIAFLRQTGRLK